ncbi:MAG: hypothetical protein JWM58_4517 [Rhizobium sp.]|nr:hypothetical protein [Rhizobium sp.]
MNKTTIEKDARGQFAPSQADRKNDGVISAIPTKVTGEVDATVNKWGDKENPPKDWDLNFNENQPRKDR